MKKKGQVSNSNACGALLALLLAVLVLYTVYRDYRNGGEFARAAGELGMISRDIEKYRLDCLAARKDGQEPPSPYDWARKNSKEFKGGSILDCLSHTLWAEEEKAEWEREQLRLQQEEAERLRDSGWKPPPFSG